MTLLLKPKEEDAMNKRLFIFVLILIVCITCLFCCTKRILIKSPIPEKSLVKIASKVFKFIENNEFDSASKLFHYPPNYTKKELCKDMKAVSSALKIFDNEFGKIKMAKILVKPKLFYEISIEGGDIPYWQKYPISYRLIYEVNFEKEGSGCVVINCCYINNKLEIRSIHYGLPMLRSGVKKRIAQISKLLD